ncbi:MAG: putative holin [Candidatus Paceibacterota bacterium]|jgi:hypothetical protein
MAEPSATTAGLAATGLTFFGVATGLDPAILIAGFAGGVWAQSYHPPMSIWRRLALIVMASILAGYLAPAAAAAVMSFGNTQGAFTLTALQLPVAVLIGLTSHRVLGPAIMRFAAKKAEGLSK